MTYDETLAWLYALEGARGWDLKLERVRAALVRIGSPERRFASVLVAGTNGKGATSAIVHAVLGEAGIQAGLFTSPHLVNFTERIRFGREEIAREAVVEGVARLRRDVEAAGIPLTFFEMATVLAFDEFARRGVPAAVLEVGLGGRLDATNAVEPVASAITSIGFDHEEFLGDTLGAIAREKAGVLRSGRAAVLGPGLPREAREAILAEARRLGANVVEANPARAELESLRLAGAHMRSNGAVALALLDAAGEADPAFRVDAGAVRSGVASVRWPGRLEVVHHRPTVVVDGAHNLEGVEALLQALPRLVGGWRPRLLFAALADKPWPEMARRLATACDGIVLTRVGGSRGVDPAEIAATLGEGAVEPDPGRAIGDLLGGGDGAPVLVAGSLYLVGEVYRVLLDRHRLGSVFEPLPGVAA